MTGFNLMILAAGYGKRMNKLTHSIPKPLLKINNKELLRHNIDFFLTATILVNENKIFNDNIYEFETKGIPFLASLGRGILKEFQEKKKGL